MYKGIFLGKASTGRIVDWKPPGKDTPAQPANGGSQAQSGSKDTKPSELAPTPSMTLSARREMTHLTVYGQILERIPSRPVLSYADVAHAETSCMTFLPTSAFCQPLYSVWLCAGCCIELSPCKAC